jgi:hypothetical protein
MEDLFIGVGGSRLRSVLPVVNCCMRSATSEGARQTVTYEWWRPRRGSLAYRASGPGRGSCVGRSFQQIWTANCGESHLRAPRQVCHRHRTRAAPVPHCTDLRLCSAHRAHHTLVHPSPPRRRSPAPSAPPVDTALKRGPTTACIAPSLLDSTPHPSLPAALSRLPRRPSPCHSQLPAVWAACLGSIWAINHASVRSWNAPSTAWTPVLYHNRIVPYLRAGLSPIAALPPPSSPSLQLSECHGSARSSSQRTRDRTPKHAAGTPPAVPQHIG